MSNFLAIDTSSRYLTVVACKGDKVVERHTADCAMKHSVMLMDEIDLALKKARLSPAECDFFAAVTGPGSFTGIRIGISAVKGFCTALSKPSLALTSFDVAAYNIKEQTFGVAVDAGRGKYYFKGYGAAECAPAYLGGEEIEKLGIKLFGFEELELKNYNRVEIKGKLYGAAISRAGEAGGKLGALYIRKSQAEEARS